MTKLASMSNEQLMGELSLNGQAKNTPFQMELRAELLRRLGAAVSASPNWPEPSVLTLEAAKKHVHGAFPEFQGDELEALARSHIAFVSVSASPQPRCPEHKVAMVQKVDRKVPFWGCPNDGCGLFISVELLNQVAQFFPASLNGEKRAPEPDQRERRVYLQKFLRINHVREEMVQKILAEIFDSSAWVFMPKLAATTQGTPEGK